MALALRKERKINCSGKYLDLQKRAWGKIIPSWETLWFIYPPNIVNKLKWKRLKCDDYSAPIGGTEKATTWKTGEKTEGYCSRESHRNSLEDVGALLCCCRRLQVTCSPSFLHTLLLLLLLLLHSTLRKSNQPSDLIYDATSLMTARQGNEPLLSVAAPGVLM
jgi:hypothetical protein